MFNRDMGRKVTHHRLADLRLMKDNNKRMFGKDITNRRTKNYSIHEAAKVQPKQRSTSLRKECSNKEGKATDIYKSQIVSLMAKQDQFSSFHIKNTQISEKNRQVLYDWLIEIHQSFRLLDQTLFLTFSYLRQFLSLTYVPKQQLQLAAVACLWIASKYQEIYPPRTKSYVNAAGGFTVEDLKQMESQIIESLKFNLVRTTALNLAESILDDNKSISLCKYLLCACELEGCCGDVERRVLVLSAIKLSDYICKVKTDDSLLKEEGSYTKEVMSACFKELCGVLQNKNKYGLTALKSKFNCEKYHYVSKVRLQAK